VREGVSAAGGPLFAGLELLFPPSQPTSATPAMQAAIETDNDARIIRRVSVLDFVESGRSV
jgi:hypothetical protein